MQELSPRARAFVRAFEVLTLATAIAYAVFLVTTDSAAEGGITLALDRAVYCSLILAGAAHCLLRAGLIEVERKAWTCIGLSFGLWGLGEVYWATITANDPNAPYPAVDDAITLCSYPFAIAGIALLARARVRRFRSRTWLDGAVAALTVSAISAAILLPPIIDTLEWTFIENAVTLAYPILDTLVVGFLMGVLILVGSRFDAGWALIFASLAMQPLVDSAYYYQEAKGTYVEGGVIDYLFAASGALVGFAAWRPGTRVDAASTSVWRSIATPTVFALVATAMLLLGYFTGLEPIAVALAGAALVVTFARMLLTYRDNQRLFERSQRDSLTGLGNRSALMLDLHEAFADRAYADDEVALVMLDLNGFKLYNDTFGHPAGDALLARLARRFDETTARHGRGYRIGGDEFCALIRCDPGESIQVSSKLAAALAEKGTVFDITAARGTVSLGREAANPSEALQLADRRMYEDKAGSRSSARSQAHEVLMSVLRERQPDLEKHVREVADLASAVGRVLGVDGEQLDVLTRAAALHDIGKTAVPDAILDKPAALTDSEWAFIRDHTVVGERIMREAPALGPVADLVRSSHERWDGGGYPDGLAGEDIPLGARIIFVCDAFEAMTSGRPYAASVTTEQALEEIERCAGTQFDPEVVEAFRTVILSTPPEGISRPAAPSPGA